VVEQLLLIICNKYQSRRGVDKDRYDSLTKYKLNVPAARLFPAVPAQTPYLPFLPHVFVLRQVKSPVN
jgi:hypothetical protein